MVIVLWIKIKILTSKALRIFSRNPFNFVYCVLRPLENNQQKYHPMHIAIAGNIGAGKTTLTTLLAKHYKWEAHFEDVVDNPYLDDFYTQMERWSFNNQIYLLKSRNRQI